MRLKCFALELELDNPIDYWIYTYILQIHFLSKQKNSGKIAEIALLKSLLTMIR